MAGGSQIIINKNGITVITPGKFEAKAGQHLFKSGEHTNYELPILPSVKEIDRKSMRFDLSQLDSLSDFSNTKYRVYKNNGSFHEGLLDSRGRTKRIFTEDTQELDLFIDHPNFIVEEEFFVEPNDDQGD
ncbi:hypothetical protein AMD27_13075 [Acinetobacter sp. TGL-Y2]|uniref:hypothetical protein n=1 Tax=Acinetobacter sp. TGL-Y2 TaxID=1407071 RepID=UPI0007A66B62|nr:hypothetical protein [Acinetobacter sp. TGL-Y2]AMW79735.1 hypothetical protein AMD27_13075 [Acinetobacter sp. TGL-Y2]